MLRDQEVIFRDRSGRNLEIRSWSAGVTVTRERPSEVRHMALPFFTEILFNTPTNCGQPPSPACHPQACACAEDSPGFYVRSQPAARRGYLGGYAEAKGGVSKSFAWTVDIFCSGAQ